MVPMRESLRGILPMNLAGADVRRLILFAAQEFRASLPRRLQFKGSKREILWGILSEIAFEERSQFLTPLHPPIGERHKNDIWFRLFHCRPDSVSVIVIFQSLQELSDLGSLFVGQIRTRF